MNLNFKMVGTDDHKDGARKMKKIEKMEAAHEGEAKKELTIGDLGGYVCVSKREGATVGERRCTRT